MTIASNIKMLREKYQLTQAEFGKIAGVSDKAVSTWEKGTAEPRMGAIQKIADHFGIDKSVIVSDNPRGTGINPSDAILLEKFNQLDENDKSVVRTMIDSLLKSDKYAEGKKEIASA